MGVFQSTTMRERAQALLAGAVTLAMAASLAVVGAPAPQAYADDDVAIAVQAAEEAVVTDVSVIEPAENNGNYANGLQITVESDNHDISYANKVILNGVAFDPTKNSANEKGANKFFVSGWMSPYKLLLTSEALLNEGENTLRVESDEEDCGNFTVTFNYAPAAAELSVPPVFESVAYKSGYDDYYNEVTYVDVSVAKDANGQTNIPAEWVNAVTSVEVGGKALTKASSKDSGATYYLNSHAFYIGIGGFADGQNTVTVKAEGYEDLTLNVFYNASAKTVSLASGEDPAPQNKVVDVSAWNVSYGKDDYNAFVKMGDLTSEYVQAISALAVNGSEYAICPEENYGVLCPGQYLKDGAALDIDTTSFVDGENTVTLSAVGYEDVVLTVYYDGAKKIASLEEIPAGLAAGAYTATYGMYAEGTENASHAAAYFDGNIKIDVADDGTMTATVLNVSSASMIKDVALGTVKDKMVSGQRTELANGAAEYVIPIPDADSDYKIGFAMNAGPHSTEVGDYANYTYADLKFADVSESWTGYASVVPFGTEATGLLRGTAVTIPNRGTIVTPSIYTLPVALMHATKDQESMAASALPQAGQLSIDDKGNATLRLTLAPVKVMGQVGYASGIKAYVGTAAGGDTVDATVVSTQKTNKGEDVPHVVEIPVASAAQAIDGVYINMFVDAMNSSVDAFVKVKYPEVAVLDSTDVKAVEEANAAIASIPALDALTVADKETVASARAAVDTLSASQKNLTSDVVVADAEARIAELEKDAADKVEAAKAEADLANATVTVAKKSVAYTGKAQKPAVTVKSKSGKALKAGTDYTVSYSANKAVGTAKVTVTGKGAYTGKNTKATFKITQAANSAKAAKASVKKTFKKAAVKKKAQAVALPKVTAKFGTAKWSVAKKDAKKVLSLKNGKVVVKKGAKKGTYSIQLKASVAKTANYKAATTKNVTVKVTVK